MIKPKRNAHSEVYPAILAVVVDCAGQVHFLMTVLIVCWVLKRGGHDAFANSQQDHIPQSNREASLNANGLVHLFPPLSTLLPACIRIRVQSTMAFESTHLVAHGCSLRGAKAHPTHHTLAGGCQYSVV